MRKLTILFAALTLSAGLWAETLNGVKYIDANGVEQTANGVIEVKTAYTRVTWGTAGQATWYVVTGNVLLIEGAVCQGDVHLILADGGYLNAIVSTGIPGIEVSGEGNSLTIYGQTAQSGVAKVTGGDGASAIGGGAGASGSNIKVAATFNVKAGNDEDVLDAIYNDGQDLANDLNGKQYATIETPNFEMVETTYIDKDGALQNITARKITSSNGRVAWRAGWYVVQDGDVHLENGAFCQGDVHLILADRAKITLSHLDEHNLAGKNYPAGIGVSGEGNALTIYGQTAQSGKLYAYAGIYAAGIGGGENGNGSNITINGGIVTAIVGEDGAAAGIGGGRQGDGHHITINGGTVTVNRNEYSTTGCAGIGGGMGGDGYNITINGGTVIVPSIRDSEGSGIGGGSGGDGYNITINGGNVTAGGGSIGGAGIGGGGSGAGHHITINGGTVTANGGEWRGGAGIGGKWLGGAGIGGGREGSSHNIYIKGGKVTATGGNGAAAIGNGERVYLSPAPAKDIYVTQALLLKADGNNPPTTIIFNDGSDLAENLDGQKYATTDKGTIQVTEDFFEATNYNGHIYDGTPQFASVTYKDGIVGLGELTVTYKQGETVVAEPTNTGDYAIYVSVAEGPSNYALEETRLFENSPCNLQILKADPTEDMFVYSAPTNLVYDGQSKYAKVTFDDQDGKLTGMGPVSLEYKLIGEDQTEATGWTSHPQDPGTYQVYVDNIGEGTNYHLSNADFTKDGWQFTITQGTLTTDDFELDNTFFIYDGQVHKADVKLKQGIKGAGDITAVTYQQGATVVESPTEVGEYDIYVSVAEGTGYAAVENMKVGKLTISLSNYFYIENARAYGDMTIGMKPYGSMSADEVPHIAYSLDGVTWTQVTYPVTDDYTRNITVSKGQKVYFRACHAEDASLPGTNATFSLSSSKYINILCNDNFKAGGNIMSLLDGANFASMTEVPSYAFYNLFNNLTYLQDASALVLPATELAEYCYASMFNGCTGMSAAPELPATTLASHCYDQMFYNCVVLQSLRVAFTDWNSGAQSTYKWMGKNSDQTDADAGRVVKNPKPKFYCPTQLNVSASPFVRNGNYIPVNWDIIKPTLSVDDFVISDNEFTYDGTPKAATVAIREGIEGVGEITVTYKQGETAVAEPTNAGNYAIYAAVTEGDYYAAFEETQVGTLTIAKATPTTDLFTYTAPEDLVYDGNAKTATVTFNDQDGTLSGMGTITILYNGNAEAPVALGNYTVSIDVAEGTNYTSATALTKDDWTFTIKTLVPIAVSYIDENGMVQYTAAWEVNSSDKRVSWGARNETTWYVVTGEDVTISKGALCDGDVRLILADGAKLTARGENTNQTPGIYVTGDNSSLTIYGQRAQSGQLVATGATGAAGIGGASGGKGKDITINGGIITAIGGEKAAGIGGGESHGNGLNIVINGGTVTASGGQNVAGIGGGEGGSASNIYISDAYVLYAGASETLTDADILAHSSATDMGSTLTQPYVKIEDLAMPYTRSVTDGQWGTVCLPYAATSFSGANFYKINYYDQTESALYVEEVTSLEAGMPYIFEATATTMTINHDATYPFIYNAIGNERGLYGSLVRTTITSTGEYAAISGNEVKWANDGVSFVVPACRAYINMNDVPTTEQPHAAPLRRVGGARPMPTEIESVHDAQCTMHDGKFLINGQLIIVRDGKTYNAQGTLVD